MFTFAKKQTDPSGKTDQFTKLIKNVKIGAKMKLKVLEFVGITASGCNNPKKPTLLGPNRCCILPIILRSAKVK